MIRVLAHLRDDSDRNTWQVPYVWLGEMPAVPRIDEMIILENMIDESSLTKEGEPIDFAEFDEIIGLSWIIEAIWWRKDEKGFYVQIVCAGG